MPHPYLPTPPNGVALDPPGGWQSLRADDLDRLIASHGATGFSDEIHGIPNPWRKPLAFHYLLTYRPQAPSPSGNADTYRAAQETYDLEMKRYQGVRGEWRGLVALLALREWQGVVVEAEKIILSESRNSGIRFARTLGALLPSASIHPGTPWDPLWILTAHGNVIGMTSPLTLVCPPSEYRGTALAGVPWFDQGLFFDPLAVGLSPLALGALKSWLERVRLELGGIARGNHWITLLEEINLFIKELGEARAGTSPSGLSHNAPLFDAPAYQPLARAVLGDTGGASDLFVKTYRGKRRIIVLPPDIAVQRMVTAESIIAWNTVSLARAVLDKKARKISGQALPADVDCLEVADIFSGRLLLISGSQSLLKECSLSFPVDAGGSEYTALAPVKPEILEWLTAKELSERLTMSTNRDGSIEFRLKFEMVREPDLMVKRTYTQQDVVKMPQPVIELWPQPVSPEWRRYYSYAFARTEADTPVQITPTNLVDVRESLTGTIATSDRYPEALICKVAGDTGILPLTEPAFQPRPAIPLWRVGIDFGTTGTMVYYSIPEGAPAPLRLSEERLRTISQTFESLRAEKVNDHFVPTETVPVTRQSFLSVWRDAVQVGDDQLKPLFDGHIHFVRTAVGYDAGATGTWTNLKWGTDQDERRRARAFLLQLCLQISAEAAAQGVLAISWRFSYPSAFSARQLDNFRQLWKLLVEECATLTGVRCEGDPRDLSESISAAVYFVRPPEDGPLTPAPLRRGAVCLDIGGGTSDIAIWQGQNQLRMYSSARFAGRDIFSGPLRACPEFIGSLVTILNGGNNAFNPTRLQQFVQNGNRAAFDAAVDAVLQDRGKDLLRELVNVVDTDQCPPGLPGFIELIQTGLSGLVFYVGKLLSNAAENELYDMFTPRVYVGGNGARLFDWACGGRFDGNHEYVTRLGNVLADASGFNYAQPAIGEQFGISLSANTKSEVAYGLVAEDTYLVAPRILTPQIVANEQTIPQEGIPVVTSLPNLRAFLVAAGNEHFSDEEEQQILDSLNGSLLLEQGKGERREESLFILALKHYLARKTRRWAESIRGAAQAGGR
jgi:hypothetical protein